MILTVTLNPVIDRLMFFEQLQLHGKNITRGTYTCLAGKGFNVAKALTTLGIETTAVGFVGHPDLDVYTRVLGARGIHLVITPIAATRTNIKIIERDTGLETEFNEPGIPVTSDELAHLCESFREHLPRAEMVTMSGSLAPNIPTGIYADLVREASAQNIRAIVDTSAKPLRAAAEARPFALRINRAELQELVNRKLETTAELADAVRSALSRETQLIVVSLGPEGALLANPSGVWFARAPRVNVVNAIGAGDVMTAGVVDGLRRGLAPDEMLRWATALATASVMTLESGAVEVETAREVQKQVRVEKRGNS
jgi:1-phosphofructokinase family hexose kinase